MEYWFISSAMASRAAILTSAGAAKSGKPWARFTALCSKARRVISRMTDSLNSDMRVLAKRRAVLAFMLRFYPAAGLGFDGAVRSPLVRLVFGRRLGAIRRHVGRCSGIEAAVHVGVSQHNLNVPARFVKRHGFDKFGLFAERTPCAPEVRAPG